MFQVAKEHAERLKELKKIVEEGQQYFRENVDRFERFMNFVFRSSLRDDEAATLAETGKPTMEFNILEAQISKQRAEFATQQPGVSVRAADGVPSSMFDRNYTETMRIIEAHMRSILSDGTNDKVDYDVYTDQLGGGWSVWRVYTDYANDMSFEQNIYVDKVFDATMTIFDPLARKSHKGDGRYCAELYPMTKESFVEEFGEEALKDITFTRNNSGFNWSFQNEQEKILLVCEFYEKKVKSQMICLLSNGRSVTKKEYDKLIEHWGEQGYMEQPPVIVKKRRSPIETICRYRFCEGRVLDYKETNFKYLPLVFVDGNSVMLKNSGSYMQLTRPYAYHAEGIQRLKNFAGQSLGNELENTVQHKFVVAIESVPEDYQEPYQNVQKADVLLYNHFLDTNNPAVTLPPPREVVRTPIPPQITDTFRLSDEMTQAILGVYDPNQGINNGALSGIAFARMALQNGNSANPYRTGFVRGLNRVAQIILDLIPKYYRTPRTIPILLPNGKREFIEVNKKGSVYMNYDPNMLQVKVEGGVNFAMQKEIALQTVISLSQSNKGFAEFFDEVGLPVILQNLEMRGIEDLQEQANSWMEQRKQSKQMQVQQQQSILKNQQQKDAIQMAQVQKEMNSPSPSEVALISIKEKARVDDANIAIKEQEAETKFLETLSRIRNADIEAELREAEVQAENTRTAVDAAIKLGATLQQDLGEITHGEEVDTGGH